MGCHGEDLNATAPSANGSNRRATACGLRGDREGEVMSVEDRVYEGADVIDSRDVIERIQELKDSRPLELPNKPSAEDWSKLSTDELEAYSEEDEEELEKLIALESEAQGYSDWTHGEALIADSFFEDHTRELAEDIGALEHCDKWPATCIDWEKAASELKQDYSSVEYGETTYWIRNS